MNFNTPEFRWIFPSYKWEDAWMVNQIINRVDSQQLGFRNGVHPETIHSSDEAIRRWIAKEMSGCSCLICFFGENTDMSDWVHYELKLARERRIGRLYVSLLGMKKQNGDICQAGWPPRECREGNSLAVADIGWYYWRDGGESNIHAWIEQAIERAKWPI